MDSRQIDVVLKSDSIVTANNFLGVFPSGKIPSVSTEIYPCCAVVNTKPHDHPGEHWVCFLKTKTNQGIYFDSYGVPPYNLPEIAEVLDGCDSWTFNDISLQTPFSTVCGQYTIFALTHLCRGFSLKDIVQLLDDTSDTYGNDALIFSYISNKYYDILYPNKLSIANTSAILTDLTKL